MISICFVWLLFSSSVWAAERQINFEEVLDKTNSWTHLILYNGRNGTCFVNPRAYQTEDENNALVQLLHKDLCPSSEEERIIQGIMQNADISKAAVGIIQNPNDGSYFSMPVEMIPVHEFKPVVFTELTIASTLPFGWAAIIAVGVGVGIHQLYVHRETLLKQARKNLEVAKMLLDFKRELLIKPLGYPDIGHWWPNGNHLMAQESFDRSADANNTWMSEGSPSLPSEADSLPKADDDLYDRLWDSPWEQKIYEDIFYILKEAKEQELGGKKLNQDELLQVKEASVQAKTQLDALALIEESLSEETQIAEELEQELTEEQKDILKKLRLLWEGPYTSENPKDLSLKDRQSLEELTKLWAEYWIKNPIYVDEKHRLPRTLGPKGEAQIEKNVLITVLQALTRK